MGPAHAHNHALGALVRREMKATGMTKADLAREAEMTPAALGDLISGRRAGANPDVRRRLAEALGENELAITCWCTDRIANHQDLR